ncbi:MAG: polysaccharide deacetylase [Lachnospiraceae bacterium]|nr:polysaccharide deacetylase [Lachnospiraceae bacterium]
MEENNKKEIKPSDEKTTKYNRKNVEKIKRLILAAFVIMFAIPVLLCIYLMIRLSSIERKLDELSLKSAADISVETTLLETTADMSQEDITAYDSLEVWQNKNETLASAYTEVASEGDADADADDNDADIIKDNDIDSEKSQNADSEDVNDTNGESKKDESVDGQQKPNGKKVYLTFDDGPSIYTDEILDILEANDVKATFFVVHYDNEDLWPAYQRIVDDGHTLAMHSYTHIYREIYADEDSFKKDIDDIHDFLYDLTGYDCKYYRFPGGSSNHVSNVDMQLCMKYLDERGIVYFDWNSLSGDAEGGYHTAGELEANVMKYVRSNEGDSVVLMHDLSDRHSMVEGLQDLIDTLKDEGYEICPIDETTPLIQHVQYDPELIGED